MPLGKASIFKTTKKIHLTYPLFKLDQLETLLLYSKYEYLKLTRLKALERDFAVFRF